MINKKKQNFWIAMAFLIIPLIIFTFFVVLPVLRLLFTVFSDGTEWAR